jgi:DNA invertase Pin-like site-specific DNA recombinase
MSDDGQQYSIDNQKAAIQEYANRHGFMIVRTYADAGKSGVVLNRREALRKLLEDVALGNTDYKAILVYDVSRWGRFQNTDEALVALTQSWSLTSSTCSLKISAS